jgi:3-methyladenine DNA glycosylase AlkC
MSSDNGITQYFGVNLAELLSDKIIASFPDFDKASYINAIRTRADNLSYTARIELHAVELHNFLPEDYKSAIAILTSILGDENPNETGMFTTFYWVMPIGKFIELYGLDDFAASVQAIEEVTKRNTGEYAIRPFIRKYPVEAIEILTKWAKSENFHLRRLASEGCRPKLPWATKLDTFVEEPGPVFNVLNLLKEDNVKFVKKSVANNLTDYLKVNFEAARQLVSEWAQSENENTKWIVKHATRKIKL